jgi:hypothetical protein
VQFVWQQALTEAAGFLDSSTETGPVAVGGWTPETMDPPTMDLTLKREDLKLRYFDPQQSLLLPNQKNGQLSRIVLPAVLPLAPGLETVLGEISNGPTSLGNFLYYELPGRTSSRPQYPGETLFDEEIRFIGYQTVSSGENMQIAGDSTDEADEIQLITFWRVEEATTEPRRIFLHVVSAIDNKIITQDDALGAPSQYWQPGDVILQQHTLVLPVNSGPYDLRLGIYNPLSGRRLVTDDGKNFVTLSDPTASE